MDRKQMQVKWDQLFPVTNMFSNIFFVGSLEEAKSYRFEMTRRRANKDSLT